MRHVIDTNVLLRMPEIIKEYECVIPSSVLREIEALERNRKSDRQLQYEIRKLKRFLDEDDVHVYIDLKDYKFTLNDDMDAQYVDNILVQICVDNGYGMISNDRLVKEKCKLYGVPVTNINENESFVENKGFKIAYMLEEELIGVYSNLEINRFDLMVNEYVLINNDVDGELLDIMVWTGKELESLRDEKGKLGEGFRTNQFDVFTPRDEQQIMAVDSIRRNPITSLRGDAGSGKSMIALNTAWHLVESEQYKLVIFVNPVPTLDSQELGFYKGGRLEKLLQSSVGTMLKSKFVEEEEILKFIQNGSLDILPFSDLRGYDTGDRTIIWILESQNLTSELMKLGLQRVGEGSKVIVDGDYHQQIDKSVYISDNGMKRMSEVFRDTDLYGEIELQHVHRSRVAEMAGKM